MARRPRRLVIDFDELLRTDRNLREFDAVWCERGYERSSARMWRRRDKSWTARVVWRNRREIVSTITFTVQGIVLP